jgi:hypothetical protein
MGLTKSRATHPYIVRLERPTPVFLAAGCWLLAARRDEGQPALLI